MEAWEYIFCWFEKINPAFVYGSFEAKRRGWLIEKVNWLSTSDGWFKDFLIT